MSQLLSNEQQVAFDLFKKGQNIFISGPGGVGKSFLINKMMDYAESINIPIKITALTGTAAILLGSKARTIHSWSGIRFMNSSMTDDSIINRISRNRELCSRWKSIKILIIDEVSMMNVRMFELLDKIAKVIRRSEMPFGGIQIIFSGDFYQLPPVCPNEEVQFCFESPLWNKTFTTIELKTFFRQTDPTFIKILMQVREGELEKDSIDILNTLIGKEKKECVTKIYPIRSRVDTINQIMFEKLEGETHTFDSKKNTSENFYRISEMKPIEKDVLLKCQMLHPENSERELNGMISNYNITEVLELKKGSSVMLTVNLDVESGLCNGSQGIVIGFDVDESPIVKFSTQVKTIRPYIYQNNEYPTHTIQQIPLCMAWALTIHKTQGATLSQIEVDIGSTIFEYGQTYVALSRVKSLEGLYLNDFDPLKIKANPKVKEFYSRET
jgi:ATP-dependent DNA helicase PIF1